MDIDTRLPETTLPADPLCEMERYWRGLYRVANDVPPRARVDPTAFATALPHAFVLDRVAPSVARFRVAGQALAASLGMDPRGMPLSIFFCASARDDLGQSLRTLFDSPAVVSLPLTITARFARHGQKGRMLLMPLRGPDGMISRALGGLVFDGGQNGVRARGPETLQIGPADRITIRPCDMPQHSAPARKRPDAHRPAFPFLRLVVDNA